VKRAGWMMGAMLLALLLTQPASAAGKTMKVKITFVSASLDENNHVGNEWLSGAYVNDKPIDEGGSVTMTLKSTDTIKLRAEAEEQDKYPDDGEAEISMKAASVTKVMTKTLRVTVVENRGRYSGNTAAWTFTFKLQKA
jgi:hypothetical protein